MLQKTPQILWVVSKLVESLSVTRQPAGNSVPPRTLGPSNASNAMIIMLLNCMGQPVPLFQVSDCAFQISSSNKSWVHFYRVELDKSGKMGLQEEICFICRLQ